MKRQKIRKRVFQRGTVSKAVAKYLCRDGSYGPVATSAYVDNGATPYPVVSYKINVRAKSPSPLENY